MHSVLVRIQNVFGFFTTVAFSVAAVIALSTFIHPQSPSSSISLSNVQVVKGRPHYYSYKKEEYAHIKFDLDADLSSLFNWNTKQVFLYLKAIYPSSKRGEPDSEAIIWDAILPGAAAPWNQNHYIHPTPKSKKSSKKPKAGEETSPYPRGVIKVTNQRPKYQITDITGKLQNRTDVRLEMGWNVQPWVGAQLWTNWQDMGVWKGLEGGKSEPFDFPALGVKGKKPDLGTAKGKEGHRLMAGEEQPRRKNV
ncbi:signal peptidase 22 kDa subunit [Periconia macrospinosa]|uniref:Signal peptidase subunit 3 n=1 Tax=Periconia macrospinosa TaxID=97972 RepID=A0A2V1DRF9_9PLEO|nr:signal peptidase 22 kDa subunit [Periconia macrospinosa]